MNIIYSLKKVALTVFIITPLFVLAQSTNDVLEELQSLMLENYVFLDKAEETNALLDDLMKSNYFDDYTSPEELADAITEQMRSITKDRHLRVVAPRLPQENEGRQDPYIQSFSRNGNPMIKEVKYLDNNIAYMDMRFFGAGDQHYEAVDLAMAQMVNANAMIIDMRYNGGGSPRMCQYLTSYFFDTEFLLNTIYTRATDHSELMNVLDVNGQKRSNIPVYILTSSRTFSGAEDFSYTMQQHQHRATIIGENTGGGAHPTRFFPLPNGYGVGIPYARTINSVTQTNWEGVGVIPDVEITADEAFDKAIEMATDDAASYTDLYLTPLEKALSDFDNKKVTPEDEEMAHHLFMKAVEATVLNEGDINNSGYNYLQDGKVKAAIAVFRSNTILYPNSANVYDSYAEALAENGEMDLALINYKKAVATATQNNNENLEAFQQNLDAFKERNK